MDGGFLATCSCSHFMTYELFTETIGQEARNVHKRLRQVVTAVADGAVAVHMAEEYLAGGT